MDISFIVRSDREYRGLSFLCTGQRFEFWIPKGEYVIGETVHNVPLGHNSPGEVCDCRELMSVSPKPDTIKKWLIGEGVFESATASRCEVLSRDQLKSGRVKLLVRPAGTNDSNWITL